MARAADVERFLDAIRTGHQGFFDLSKPVTVSRAPGRLDVMGGIADYSGSLVLQGTLKEATFCAVQPRDDRTLNILSLDVAAEEGMSPLFTVSGDYVQPPYGDDPYALVKQRMRRDPKRRWAAYVAGVFTVLEAEGIATFSRGADIVISSDVPLGSGVSSSAALEVAVMSAVLAAYEIKVPGMKLATMCQTVENEIVGAPCGVMDQVASVLGEKGKLIALRCQPHDLEGVAALPAGIRCVGLNTNVKHSVGGSRYTEARVGAFMGQRLIEQEITQNGRELDPTKGYLANITTQEFAERWRDFLPTEMLGIEFISRYHRTNDPVTAVDPLVTYKVRSRTEHPVYENERVEAFLGRLESAQDASEARVHREMVQAGKLMYGSHWSYGARCGMGCPETDLVVRLVKELGPDHGFYGAKITGGGSGGTVAILCREGTNRVLRKLARTYAQESGHEPQLFLESGPGAATWGTRQIVL
jgi:galactokinase